MFQGTRGQHWGTSNERRPASCWIWPWGSLLTGIVFGGWGGDFGVTLGALEVICVLFVKMKRNKVFLRYIDCIISVSAAENEGSIL